MAKPSWRSSGRCTGTAPPTACATPRCATSTPPAADPDGEIGEDHEPETHLIPLVLRAALGRGNPVEIYGTDYPTPRRHRDPRLHPRQRSGRGPSARARTISPPAATACALNLGTGHGCSVREVIAAVERIGGRPVPQREAARRPGDPPELVADPALAQSRLGWQPRYSDLDTIIAHALAWETRPGRTA